MTQVVRIEEHASDWDSGRVMRTKTARHALVLAALMGLNSAASAELWITTSAYTGPDVGDPLTFTGNGGTVVTIDGFRTDMVGTGVPYSSGSAGKDPTAYAWGYGVGVDRDGSGSDYHTIGNNASSLNWTDGILLSFDKSVNIGTITLASNKNWGDGSSDKDAELWVFTGEAGSAGLPTTAYSTWAPGANGWTLASTVNGGEDNTSGTDVDTFGTANAHYSSLWMVLAANQDHLLDAYKFKKFTGGICTNGCGGGPSGGVPLPGTLALLGIGALMSRRRSHRAG